MTELGTKLEAITRAVTISRAKALGELVQAVEHDHHVARYDRSRSRKGEMAHFNVYGEARAILDHPGGVGGLPGPDTDIRTCYLWVTTYQGWEEFWPIDELVTDMVKGWAITSAGRIPGER
jgi:hypothetical protein